MKLWAVYLGWGLFVVRAATEAEAIDVALAEAEQYGHDRNDFRDVTELSADGPPALLAEHYG